jgi:uncharacterized protein YecT (DUF1311 family)
VTGDGKLDILAGDRFSSGGGMRADLTEEEKAAYEKTDKEYQKVMQEYFAAYEKYNEAYQAALKDAEKKNGEKLSKEAQRALRKEHITDKVANDESIKSLQVKMRELGTELNKYRAASVSGGNVWVYEQK